MVPPLHTLVQVFPLAVLHDNVDVIPGFHQIQNSPHLLYFLQEHQNSHLPPDAPESLSFPESFLLVDFNGDLLAMQVIIGFPDLSIGSFSDDLTDIEPVLEVQSRLTTLEIVEVSHDLENLDIILSVVQEIFLVLLLLHNAKIHLFIDEFFQLQNVSFGHESAAALVLVAAVVVGNVVVAVAVVVVVAGVHVDVIVREGQLFLLLSCVFLLVLFQVGVTGVDGFLELFDRSGVLREVAGVLALPVQDLLEVLLGVHAQVLTLLYLAVRAVHHVVEHLSVVVVRQVFEGDRLVQVLVELLEVTGHIALLGTVSALHVLVEGVHIGSVVTIGGVAVALAVLVVQ